MKPSGPDTLTEGIWFMASLISDSVKSLASILRLCGEIYSWSQFKLACTCGSGFMIFWKCSWTFLDHRFMIWNFLTMEHLVSLGAKRVSFIEHLVSFLNSYSSLDDVSLWNSRMNYVSFLNLNLFGLDDQPVRQRLSSVRSVSHSAVFSQKKTSQIS
jgi:hypothetical protein